MGRLGAPGGLRARRPDERSVPRPRDRVPALGLLVRRGDIALVHDDACVLPRRGGVVLAGGLAPALAVAAVDVVEPRAVPDAAAPARCPAVRDRRADGLCDVLLEPAR